MLGAAEAILLGLNVLAGSATAEMLRIEDDFEFRRFGFRNSCEDFVGIGQASKA